MRRLIVLLLTAVMCILFIPSAAASPAVISADDYGSASNLIIIKKPESAVSSTTKKSYAVSAVGTEGLLVTLYRWDGSQYVLMYGSDGSPAESYIGPSGIFVKQINLQDGVNKIAVRAELYDGTYQTVYLEINVIDQGLFKNFSINLQAIFNGWLN